MGDTYVLPEQYNANALRFIMPRYKIHFYVATTTKAYVDINLTIYFSAYLKNFLTCSGWSAKYMVLSVIALRKRVYI